MAVAPVAPQDSRIGPGCLRELGDLIGSLVAQTALLVTGCNGYVHSGACRLVEPALARLRVQRLSGVTANPQSDAVERGVALWRMHRPDIIVAIGGGSVLDTAKLISLLGPADAPWTAFCRPQAGAAPARVPVIAIPTTAGSGAEATQFATFYEAGEKHSICHPLLRPSHAIVDPLLTASMPPELTAITGLDALAQAIESLWAVGSTPDSQYLAAEALVLIVSGLKASAGTPTVHSRDQMARGAHLAGRAIDISRTTAAHALSYPLTARLDIAHGHAVALLLPWIFRINARPEGRAITDTRGAAHLADSMSRIVGLLGCTSANEAAGFLQRLLPALGLSTCLVSMDAARAAALASQVNADRLGNNPVMLSAGDIRAIYARLAGFAAPE